MKSILFTHSFYILYKHMNVTSLSNYDYILPEGRIAQTPMEDRTAARLMVVNRHDSSITHKHISDLPDILAPLDCMVFNNTQVVPARLRGVRTLTGGSWEGLFLRLVTEADLEDGSVKAELNGAQCHDVKASHGEKVGDFWNLLGSTRGKLQAGENITLLDHFSRPFIRLKMVYKCQDGSWLARPESELEIQEESNLKKVSSDSYLEILQHVGSVPIPPYIRKGHANERDVENYQTIYAARPGAVAAPTAGLHFTRDLMDRISSRGIQCEYVTLHVGQGTFRPISAENLEEHHMHSEWAELTEETARKLQVCRKRGGRIVAVGTTSVRVLETAAREGSAENPYQPFRGETSLFIRPGFHFRAVDALLTNFHLPKSTLLVLVRTYGTDALIKRAYEEAIQSNYRFYSYGDAMLIL